MTVSFLFPDPQFIDFFITGQHFIGYTLDSEEIKFVVVDQEHFICDIEGLLCVFNPTSWMMVSELSHIFQLNEMIPCSSH